VEGDAFTVDFFEHCKHVLQVVVVKKPNLRILVILLKRNSKAVRDIHNTGARLLIERLSVGMALRMLFFFVPLKIQKCSAKQI
jgi:hypothetical protein